MYQTGIRISDGTKEYFQRSERPESDRQVAIHNLMQLRKALQLNDIRAVLELVDTRTSAVVAEYSVQPK